jgi:hypothetical protein
VILEGEECELVQVAVYREGRPEDMLGFDANSTLSRRIVKPVFEAALTYEAATGVIEVVAKTREDRIDLTRYMARDLLGITLGEDQSLPLREYDLSMLLRPFDFPTDPADGIASVTVKELRLMDLGDAKERITLESMSGADRTIWQMAEHRIGLDIGGGAHVFGHAGDVPEWVITRARYTIKFHPGPSGGRGKSLTLTVTMPHGCNLKDMTPQERLIGEKYLRLWGILKDDNDEGDVLE